MKSVELAAPLSRGGRAVVPGEAVGLSTRPAGVLKDRGGVVVGSPAALALAALRATPGGDA